ncbi:MAG: hypothetical protein Q7T50_03430 [Candidatus Magasanikbacteria bacterium]|nr:hypothetical protein [Candidatus Magasanikbacteria bacterium]
MKNYNNNIMVVAGKDEFKEIKRILKEMGFHHLYIFLANSQTDALCEISLIQDTGCDIDVLIFDYSHPEIEFEKIFNLIKLENDITKTIPKIVMLDLGKIQFVRNSDQFKESEIIFITPFEMVIAIKKTLGLED